MEGFVCRVVNNIYLRRLFRFMLCVFERYLCGRYRREVSCSRGYVRVGSW